MDESHPCFIKTVSVELRQFRALEELDQDVFQQEVMVLLTCFRAERMRWAQEVREFPQAEYKR